MLEDVQRKARHLRIRVEQREQSRIRHQLFEKVLKRSRAAPQLHEGNSLRQRWRAFIQKPNQIAGRGLYNFRRFDLRRHGRRQAVVDGPLGMDHALVNFLHRFQMRVQFLQQFLARIFVQ